MEEFRIEGDTRSFEMRVEEVTEFQPELVRTLVDIDLQTFSEPTFGRYTASALLRSGRVFLLHADDKCIGTCVCVRTWDRPNEVLLLSMGIRPGWRGRGLGQRFLTGVLSKLRARGLRAVTLNVSADNRRALKMYQDVDFAPTGETIEDPRTGEEFVVMKKTLAPEPIQLLE